MKILNSILAWRHKVNNWTQQVLSEDSYTGADSNPTAAMKKSVPLDGGPSKSKSIWRNIRKIPNVESFRVTARVWDQVMMKFGLHRKTGGFIEYIAYRNRDINRFVEHQLIRMSKAKDQDDWATYWRIAEVLLFRSKCFYVLALYHTFPRWYKEMPWGSMLRLYRKTRDCVNSSQMNFARVYIEKANGKWRPLGVPSPAWRIWLCMINLLLVYAYDDKLHPNQHGFRPGRGTLSAWRQVLTTVLDRKNIYEYDLTQFFDRVNTEWTISTLAEWGLPHIWQILLRQIIHSDIRLPKDLKTDETAQLLRRQTPLKQRIKVSGRDNIASAGAYSQGFPQGAAISPFMANVTLEDTLFTMNPGFVQYADDGLFYGDGPINLEIPKSMVKANIEMNESKSGWIRKDGVWLKPLKFLGLVYDGTRDEIRADTRSGSKLVFDKEGLLKHLEEEDLGEARPSDSLQKDYKETRKSWASLAKSRFFGFVQSRLYNGSWNQEELWNNFLLQATSDSWVGQVKNKLAREAASRVTLFNASSIASRALISLLRKADGLAHNRWALANHLQLRETLDEEEVGSQDQEPTPIKLHMAAEWKRAYRMSWQEYDGWVLYYISRMKHSKYSAEHMYFWYRAKWIHRRHEALSKEYDLIRGLYLLRKAAQGHIRHGK